MHDKDLVGVTGQPPCPAQIALQRHTQRKFTLGSLVIKTRLALYQGSVIGFAPRQHREVVKGQGAI